MRNITDDPQVQSRALQLVSDSTHPVTVGFVAFHLGVHYLTARTILLTLLAQGRINGERTTRSWIFRKKVEQQSLVGAVAQPTSMIVAKGTGSIGPTRPDQEMNRGRRD